MNQANLPHETEITLAHLLKLTVGYWKVLLVVGVAAGVLAAIVLQLLPSSYEASSTILVTRTRANEQMVGLDNTAIQLDSFAAALQSKEVLERLFENFRLDGDPYRYDLERFEHAVTIAPLRNENSIRITVKLPALMEETPELTANLANAFAAEADEIANSLLEEDIERSLEFFESQYRESENRLDEIQRETYRVRSTAPIEEKTRYITNQEMLQRQLQASWALALADLVQKEQRLEVLRGILEEEEPLRTVTRFLEEEPSLLGVVSDRTQASAADLYRATSSAQLINDVYVNVRDLHDGIAADVAGLRKAVEDLPESIDECTENMRAAEAILSACQALVKHHDDLLETAHLGFREVYSRFEMAKLSIVSDRQDLIGGWVRAYPPTRVSGAPKPVLAVTSAVLAMSLFLAMLLLIEVARASIRNG